MKLSEIAEDAKVPQKPRQGPLRPQTGAGKHQDKKKAMKQGKEKHKKPFSEGGYDDQFSLGGRLEKDNDFRNRERNAGVEHERNNYQVSINGRPWKVFADQRQAMNIARSLKMKGKQVEVYPTGAPPSESIEEVDRRGFLRGLGAAALGATGIKAQASQDQDLGNGFKLVTIDIAGYTVKAVLDTQTKTYYTLNRRPDGNGAIIRNMAPYIFVRDGKVNMASTVGPETAAAMKKAGLEKMQEGVAEGSEHYNGIEISMEKEDDEIMVTAMMSGGRELGHVLFVIDGDYLMPQDLEVDERYQGQGIAATMYDYVKSKGYKIRRSGQQTDAGAGFWDKHKPGKNVWEQGVAEGPAVDAYMAGKSPAIAHYADQLDRIASKTESRMTCPECGGPAYLSRYMAEEKDACYHKVRSRYKVWPSAYASGALVQCRKKGAANWGNKGKK